MFEWDGIGGLGGGGSTDHHQLFNRVTRPVDEQSLKLFLFEQTRCQVLQVLFVLVVCFLISFFFLMNKSMLK